MFREKKLLVRDNKVAKFLIVLFKKNTEAATGGAEAVIGDVL